MRKVKGEGMYTRKATGEEIGYAYEYPVYEAFDELVQALGKERVLAISNQTLKEDNANNSREEAKRTNGDSSVRLLSSEEKEARKAQAREDRGLLKALKASGASVEDVQRALEAVLAGK